MNDLFVNMDIKTQKKYLLYIDDEESNLDGFVFSFRDYYIISVATSPKEVLASKDLSKYQVVITDQKMPGMTGLQFIAEAKKKYPDIIYIVLTGYADVELAMDAINRLNVYKFLQKPWDPHELKTTIDHAFNTYFLKQYNRKLLHELKERNDELEKLKTELESENQFLKNELIHENEFGGIKTQNPTLKKLLEEVREVAGTDASVFIHGETGTGKELVARGIHMHSSHSKGLFVKINCAAIPDTLIESELFGHEKGAFTGAIQQHFGRFEQAHNGTLFLDEIGEIPLDKQAKLLRVLQEGEFERIGGNKTIKVNVRIISATNRDLTKEIEKGKFRVDLFYRICVYPIHLPPLRERKDDISLLTDHFIQKYSIKYNRKIRPLGSESLELLKKYDWPGNIRELENIIERAMITNNSGNKYLKINPFINTPHSAKTALKSLEDMERDYIKSVLQMTNWRIRGEKGAAEILNVKPTTLHSKIKKLNISRY
ncbi:MAG: sigma-54-dependent Fis family transcriptional regulator [Bacteroidales bacterium]|nr:sigma-54-dependent Fis family transcriptional regulator [Bacteroidales bacterium]